MKYAAIEANDETTLTITRLLRLLNVPSSSYYDWLKREPSHRHIENQALDALVTQVYWAYRGYYGYRRVYRELVDEHGYSGSCERIRRRMKHLGLKAIVNKRFKVTTDSVHNLPVAPNMLNQDFSTNGINEVWVSDITYIRVGKAQWMYLAVVLDCHSRQIIGWSMHKRMKASLVCDALSMAIEQRGKPFGVIVHTDRGSQYCSKTYRKLLRDNKLNQSMSGKGNCYDNAMCESFFHTLKTEHVYRFRYETRGQAKRSIFWYIEAFYNRKRRHSSLDYQSPLNFEKQALKNAA